MFSGRSAYWPIVLVFSIIVIIGLLTINDYGVSWDEPVEIEMVKQNLDMIFSRRQDVSMAQFYGLAFNGFSELIFKTQEKIGALIGLSSKGAIQNNNKENTFFSLSRIRSKHYVTFFFSLIAYGVVAAIVTIFCGLGFAWIGPVILALCPRWWGHSFFNPKDVPFAVLMILSVYFGGHLIDQFLKKDSTENGFNRRLTHSILFGIFIGVVSGVRIGGFVFLWFIFLAHLVLMEKKKLTEGFIRFIPCYVHMFLTWAITTIVFYPSSWSNPIRQLLKIIYMVSDYHEYHKPMLFQGEFISPQNVPWYYLPQWMMISIPFSVQILFVIGLFYFIVRYRQFSILQKACTILLLLEIFFLPMVAIVKKSTLYDGMRQFLFVLPGLACVASIGAIRAYQGMKNGKLRCFLVAAIVSFFILIIHDMKSLHPFESIYFNRLFGGLRQAHNRYETDYWGLSLREGVEWINQRTDTHNVVLGAAPFEVVSLFTKPEINILKQSQMQQKNARPFYYLTLTRWRSDQYFPECSIVHQVTRDNVPLTVIKKCV